ncbi:hypothetical protein CLAFUW4_09380 [Fulvia fulva]|uniref:Uncharacterized protein n=1 Tax=Passalora fulva TaxID=5499 RepID=A0A9Q8PFM5_PASFU|nr:uncharacterized protein CLAFUR5_09479 [Fulvia fulva]KAK4613989.1 hypothetical protein CLAFUR4_09386 [Fulvia fulva]KAK4614864.1 hypothetical protein CLAFUR0_09377 [Fulvia fulva]UJO21559.1 hypothetical protein CLAFUR5_09479 [Fulvia fulva]WPV20005.1 hypothetical protein CLAFUW4_09380 [Fulvia fulva]WPV35600.1 hypothetical protein CLAFUW7_09381 [Fulvia fulva]
MTSFTTHARGNTNYTPFRFLDLPAELRLNVYCELLLRDELNSPEPRYSQIIATSRMIQNEAESVLYVEHVPRIKVVHDLNAPKSKRGASVVIAPFITFISHRNRGLWHVEQQCSRHSTLEKFKQVEFHKDFYPIRRRAKTEFAWRGDLNILKHHLYNMACHLGGGRCEKLRIKIEGDFTLNEEAVGCGAAWPLRNFGSHVEISSPEITASIWRQLVQTVPEGDHALNQDVARLWYDLKQSAQQLIADVKGLGWQRTGVSVLETSLEPVERRFDDVRFSQYYENVAAQKVQSFQRYLEGSRMEELRGRVEGAMRDTQQREAGEESTALPRLAIDGG